MAKPCSVCAHPQRAEIDMRLALQVVNMSEVGRMFGVSHDAVTRHRKLHLPSFLPAFAALAQPLAPGTIQAEAERLYLTTLDALAQAQAGVLAAVGEGGEEYRRVSMSTVARLIREARAGLDMLTKLSVAGAGPDSQAPQGINAELDARIAAAMDRVEKRALSSGDVVDAEVVEEDLTTKTTGLVGKADGAHPTTPGPGAAATPAASRVTEGPISSETPSRTREPRWLGNAAASDEERRAAGQTSLPISTPRTEDADTAEGAEVTQRS